MFTGIIKATGTVGLIEPWGSSLHLWIHSPLSEKLEIDQSVSHNGICLTVDKKNTGAHRLTVVKETIERTNLKSWTEGTQINLELSATPATLLDGHIVQGHVDNIAKVLKIQDVNGSWYFHFQLPESNAHLVVEKGSIAVNGVSLTVAQLTEDSFSVAIIPYTYENTGFKNLKEGDFVNLEYDVIGKYVARMLKKGN